jgi:hypothetical protein
MFLNHVHILVPDSGPHGTKHAASIDDCVIGMLWLMQLYTPIMTVIFI